MIFSFGFYKPSETKRTNPLVSYIFVFQFLITHKVIIKYQILWYLLKRDFNF